jgi:hypothetical protein
MWKSPAPRLSRIPGFMGGFMDTQYFDSDCTHKSEEMKRNCGEIVDIHLSDNPKQEEKPWAINAA